MQLRYTGLSIPIDNVNWQDSNHAMSYKGDYTVYVKVLRRVPWNKHFSSTIINGTPNETEKRCDRLIALGSRQNWWIFLTDRIQNFPSG